MKPTITYRKKDSLYELISRAKKALRAMGTPSEKIFEIGVEANKKRGIEEIKRYLRNYVIILEEV